MLIFSERRLEPAQIAEAQKLAAEYFEKYKAKSVSDD